MYAAEGAGDCFGAGDEAEMETVDCSGGKRIRGSGDRVGSGDSGSDALVGGERAMGGVPLRRRTSKKEERSVDEVGTRCYEHLKLCKNLEIKCLRA